MNEDLSAYKVGHRLSILQVMALLIVISTGLILYYECFRLPRLEHSRFSQLKAMFSQMVEHKDLSLTDQFYHPEFLLYTNGLEMTLEEMQAGHEKIYATPIEYRIDYDERTLVESGDRLAVRTFITTSLPDESPKEIEVFLFATYKDDKLYRVWELTFPDWSKMEAFEGFDKS